MSERILVVEDDEALGAQLVSHLERGGWSPTWIRDGDEARGADPREFALVILDLMLPGTYGMDLLKLYRQRSDLPILILSARESSDDKVRALRLGADDYVTKPFWPEELVARVAARLRRPLLNPDGAIRFAGHTLDLDARQLSGPEGAIELTRVEFDLLAALGRRMGSAMSRHALVEAALDPDKMGGERTLDVHISRLRKKLGRAGKAVATVWGVGYRLERELPEG